MELPLARAFARSRLPSEPQPSQALDAALRAVWERGRAAWPTLTLPAEALVEHLARCLPPDVSAPAALGALCAEDLYLACGCARGDAEAVRLFEQRYAPVVSRALARAGATGTLAAEVRQAITVQLLVGDAASGPRLASYRGEGGLAAWLRVTVVRAAIKQRRRGERERPLASELSEALTGLQDLELAHLKAAYGELFSDAFRRALTSLDERDRMLLRRHHLERCAIKDLAGALGVHRVTVARWIDEARRALLARTKAEVRRRTGLDTRDCDSMLALARSRLDLSMAGLRADEG